MRTFKTKWFDKWATSENLENRDLLNTIDEMNQGLMGNPLGGDLYKKRMARPGQGKSGGYRTILAFRVQDKAFFLYGFSKNVRANINKKELKALKKLATELLSYSSKQLEVAMKKGELIEVKDNG